MALGSDLLRGVYEYGFEVPSAFQQRIIPPAIQGNNIYLRDGEAYNQVKGNDIVGVAQSASGKTSALCISVLQRIDPNVKACQALILVVNHDSAGQIHKTIGDIGRFMQMSRSANNSKSDARNDMDVLHDTRQFVIGEPGQVYDMTRSGAITTDNIKLLFVDEADELSSRNIAEQICGLHGLLPDSTQVVFLSSTMPQYMLDVAAKLMRNPLHIIVGRTKHPLDGIKQSYMLVETEDHKLDILSELDATSALAQRVIFCNTRKKLEWLAQKLTVRGLAISAMHGDMPASERAAILASFRSSASHVLLATQMLARGIDKQQMALIVNFELPANPADYIHGTGLGRHSGRKNSVINLITADDASRVREIEQLYNTRIEKMR